MVRIFVRTGQRHTLVACPRHLSSDFRTGHPGLRRCSSIKYSRYSQSSRLAIRAPRSEIRCTTDADGPLGSASRLETDLPVVADDAESTLRPLIGQPAPFGAECQIETLRQVPEGPRCLAEVLILLLEMRPLFFEALDDGLTLHEVGRSLRPQNSSHGAQRPSRTRPPPLSGMRVSNA